MKTAQPGIELIKEFEGFRCSAYLCPSGVWTIGYGHTKDVHPGDYVTKDRGEEYLRQDLAYFEDAVADLITVPLNQFEFDALVSFTFNCGAGALGESTLRKRLNAGEPKCKVFSEELPKWVNGANGPLPGLVRRRDAEVELACSQDSPIHAGESQLLMAVDFYEGSPMQIDAWSWLEEQIPEDVMNEFISHQIEKDILVTPLVPVKEPEWSEVDFPLDVPYFYQHDSATSHGGRMCYTSSMAMALDYIDPDKIDGDDDWYLNIVLYYGDTVSSEAQVAAARSLGYSCDFVMDGSEGRLIELLDQGIPVPIGILHHGPVDHPSGGGHWICLIGYDEKYFHVHDPAGELNLVGGGYPKSGPTDGKNQRYTRKNLMKRWLIANDNDGWLMDLS